MECWQSFELRRRASSACCNHVRLRLGARQLLALHRSKLAACGKCSERPSRPVSHPISHAAGSTGARRKGEDAAARKRPAADGAEGSKDKKRRKRKKRLPAGFDPANPGPLPDPERWLPKWQRSDFKKKRNRRKDKVGCGAEHGASRLEIRTGTACNEHVLSGHVRVVSGCGYSIHTAVPFCFFKSQSCPL